MFRIVTSSSPKATNITVDGELKGERVAAVAFCCKQAIDRGRPVHLKLREVPNIDERGRALLCRLVAQGVSLTAAGIYGSHVVGGIRRDNRLPRPQLNEVGN